MAVSTTGGLRSSLALHCVHLTNKTDATKTLLARSVARDDPQAIEDRLHELRTAQGKLCRGLEPVTLKLATWQDVFSTLHDQDALDLEQRLYDAVAERYTDAIVAAEDALEEIQAEVRLLEATLTRLVNPPPAVLASQPPSAVPAGQPPAFAASVPPPQPATVTGSGTQAAAVSAAQPHTASGAAGLLPGTPGSATHRTIPLKLPKLSLPTFSGDYLDWKQFWGIFDANIHCRTDLTNIEKFTYLIQHLSERARQIVAGLTIDGASYNDAVELLKERFDRSDERMISMLYSELKRLPPAEGTTASKQKTMDTCEKIFRILLAAPLTRRGRSAMMYVSKVNAN